MRLSAVADALAGAWSRRGWPASRVWALLWLGLAASACGGVTPPGQPTPTPGRESSFGQSVPRILTPAPSVAGDPRIS